MVNCLIESLLSNSRNRVLYESLWTLGLTRSFKPGNLQSFDENQSIVAICNEIIDEIVRDDPDRNSLYFSTQIVFGTVLLYRNQVDKLFNQVKFTLQACTATFYEINWLDSIAEQANQKSQFSQLSTVLKNQKRKKKNEKKRQPLSEFDLIEEAFTICNEELKNTRSQGDHDPTMAINNDQITIYENFTPLVEPNNVTEDDFGDFGATNGGQFGIDFDVQNVSRVLNTTYTIETSFHSPEVLRKEASSSQNPFETLESYLAQANQDTLNEQQTSEQPSFFHSSPKGQKLVEVPELSLAEDIRETLANYQKSRKRRSSFSVDISHRLGSKMPKLNDEKNNVDNDANNNSVVDQNKEISAFEINVNVSESVGNIESNLTKLVSSTLIEEKNLEKSDQFAPDISAPLSPILKHPNAARKVKKQKKLIVDRVIKINNDVIKSNMDNYQRRFAIKPPMESFNDELYRIKLLSYNLFIHPSTRLIRSPKFLVHIFERNLKRIPKPLLKRNREEVKDCQKPSSTKKRRENSFEVVKELEIEIAPLAHIELSPVAAHNRPSTGKITLEENSLVYDPSDKWSKQKIMTSLRSLWKHKNEPITMPKLARNTNRFVAAGIFFELMVMSKAGSIELVGNDELKIIDILQVKKATKFV